MPTERAPYSRIYHSIVDDPKFAAVYDDDRRLATWLRLLIVAEQAHPASAYIPAGTNRGALRALCDAGLVDIGTGSRYRIHGLDAERGRRSDAARVGGFASGRSRSAEHPLNERGTKSNLAETSKDETRRAPRANTIDKNPELAAQRAAQIERYGNGMDAPIPEPTKTLTAVDREREARRHEANALHERFKRGELDAETYERLRADIGKEPDDLTRLQV